jgi:hypothetical protein
MPSFGALVSRSFGSDKQALQGKILAWKLVEIMSRMPFTELEVSATEFNDVSEFNDVKVLSEAVRRPPVKRVF